MLEIFDGRKYQNDLLGRISAHHISLTTISIHPLCYVGGVFSNNFVAYCAVISALCLIKYDARAS